MSNKIPTKILFCTTVVATACTKSNEEIAADTCNLATCGYTDEILETYAEYWATTIEECSTEWIDKLEDLEGGCKGRGREFYICFSNLTCDQFLGDMGQSACAKELEAWTDCESN